MLTASRLSLEGYHELSLDAATMVIKEELELFVLMIIQIIPNERT